MSLLSNINIITILIIGLFLMPLLTGLLSPISSNRIQHSFLSILNSVILILGDFFGNQSQSSNFF